MCNAVSNLTTSKDPSSFKSTKEFLDVSTFNIELLRKYINDINSVDYATQVGELKYYVQSMKPMIVNNKRKVSKITTIPIGSNIFKIIFTKDQLKIVEKVIFFFFFFI